jgi:hypothetical protein
MKLLDYQSSKNKRWATSKAVDISIHEKLQQAKEYVKF